MEQEIYHVLPVNDLKDHNQSGKFCHCKPRVEREGENWIVVHNSYDGREFFEEKAGH